MPVFYKSVAEGGYVTTFELDATIAVKLTILPEQPRDYFTLDDVTFFLPVQSLVTTRAREKGILQANILMAEAAKGASPKRKPIEVEKAASGLWLVADGNSTVINAIASGWREIPCSYK